MILIHSAHDFGVKINEKSMNTHHEMYWDSSAKTILYAHDFCTLLVEWAFCVGINYIPSWKSRVHSLNGMITNNITNLPTHPVIVDKGTGN